MTRMLSFLHGCCMAVRDGNGQKGRVTMLLESLVSLMQEQMESVRPQHARGGVLARCADSTSFLRQGFRVIPGVGWCAAIVWMTGRFSGRSGRRRPAPHTFRHSFATQLLEPGCGIRRVQGLLGRGQVLRPWATGVAPAKPADYVASEGRLQSPIENTPDPAGVWGV